MTPLRQRMLEDMEMRNMSPNTRKNYIRQVAQFAMHFGKSPDQLGPEEIRTYLLSLVRRDESCNQFNVCRCALRFFFRVTLKREFPDIVCAKRPKKLPVVLSQSEVAQLLAAPKKLKHRAMLTALYAAGLRVSELVGLRVADIDSKRMVIRVRQGKGSKDRYVMLSPKLLELLREYWKERRPKERLFPVTCRCVQHLCAAMARKAKLGKFLALFHDAFRNGRLSFHGQQQTLADPALFVQMLDSLRQTEWVVYAKPPFGGPEQVLKYLARYTHRVAISNHRLIKMEDGKVYFHWKDYAHGGVQKTMALDAVEFIRRFLQHVVPSGFVRIRHFGFLAYRGKEENLQRCRQLLIEAKASASVDMAAPPVPVPCQPKSAAEAADWHRCPQCGRGHMIIVERFEAGSPPTRPTVALSVPEDTS